MFFLMIFCKNISEQSADKLTLEQIQIFTSGASAIPRFGFPVSTSIEFLHHQGDEPVRIFPEANTRAIILRLPIHATYMGFKEKMESGILQSPTFGTISFHISELSLTLSDSPSDEFCSVFNKKTEICIFCCLCLVGFWQMLAV